jgi:6,7-dimethyl-8-ribityllumazine synthase
VADAPTSPDNYKQVTTAIIPDKGSGSFKNNAWNRSLSSAGSVLIFIGSLLTIGALVGGLIKHRFAFLVAAVCSGLSAFLLMVGAAIWTSIIAKDSVLQAVKVEGGVSLGIVVKVGPALGEWNRCQGRAES